MARKRTRLFVVLAVIALIAALVMYAGRPKPIAVVLKPAEHGTVESTVANTRAGTVMACQRARLAPAIGGQIAALPVTEGDAVKAGQLLLEMWNDDRKAEVLLSQRDEVSVRARADEACVTAAVAMREAARSEKLRKQNLASEEDVDRARGEAQARTAGCAAARSAVSVAAARTEVAEAGLERTRLRAPFDGTVAEVNGELGEFVTPSPIGVPTPPAVDLVDNSCLYVAAPIDEVDAPAIRAGMPARISLDAFPDTSFTGTVRRVAPYVLDLEKQARTVGIEAEFRDKKDIENMLPGYSADVEVILSVREDVLRVPTAAILEGNRVFIYRASDHKLEERTLETGISNWEYTEVTGGMTAGERIVISVDRDGVEAGALVEPEKDDK